MPQQTTTNVENNFTKGLITEATGLNFPENAATDTDNCTYNLVGDVSRREGFDLELNRSFNNVPSTNAAKTTYKWDNAGGDGQTQIIVTQIGNQLNFYVSSNATDANPLSGQLLSSIVTLSDFTAQDGVLNPSLECQYTSGNGYLFVFHPNIDSIYCTYSGGVVTANSIVIKIRDFVGAQELGNPTVTARPLSLTAAHNYNLINQGWSSANSWDFTSRSRVNTISPSGGSMTFNDAPAGLPINVGDPILITGGIQTNRGTNTFSIFAVVQSYVGNVLFVLISSYTQTGNFIGAITDEIWYVQPATSANYINAWHGQVSNFPSNADVWWRFKNSSGVFNPATTIANVTLSSPAPKGSLILDAFNQQFSTVTGVSGLGVTQTTIRPRTGAWFQGRVFYAGVDASEDNSGPGSNAFYTWTENIYFSQVNLSNTTNFGYCYQVNDPTSQDLFDLLPTDGGVITIPGCGAIYKLFPVQNGLLVFAANGVWFITGSQGIGFSASDYTIVKLSQVQSISGSSFTNVLGLPYFWNEEGIYQVQATQTGQLSVEPITVGTILDFFNAIPVNNRKYVRGDYHPIEYNIQWIFKSEEEISVDDRYQFDRVLNYNTYNKAFFPYTVAGPASIAGIVYVSSPGGTTTPDPIFKFFTRVGDLYSWSEERDDTFVDFKSVDTIGTDYESFFVTGYKIRGQAIRQFQPQYLMIYSRIDGEVAGYNLQGLWDYAIDRNSNRFSSLQRVTIAGMTRFGVVFRRHKIRGHGRVLQFKVSSTGNLPFHIIGWAVVDTVNQGA